MSRNVVMHEGRRGVPDAFVAENADLPIPLILLMPAAAEPT
jgi:hypothetical protein